MCGGSLPSPGLKICTCPYRLLAYSVNGVEESAVKWVYVLGEATLREDLNHLTLLAFQDFLCSLSPFRRFRTWCPACCLPTLRKADETYHVLIATGLLWSVWRMAG